MKLTVEERFVILQSMRPEGDILYIRALRELTNKVGLSADEIEEYDVHPIEVNGEQRIKWDDKIPQEKDIALTGGEVLLIVEALKKLDDEKKLESRHETLYTKFVDKIIGEKDG